MSDVSFSKDDFSSGTRRATYLVANNVDGQRLCELSPIRLYIFCSDSDGWSRRTPLDGRTVLGTSRIHMSYPVERRQLVSMWRWLTNTYIYFRHI